MKSLEVTLRAAAEPDKRLVAEMMPEYFRDLQAYAGTRVLAKTAAEYPYFDAYWQEKDRYPFLILANQTPVGFALIRYESASGSYDLCEFFVRHGERRAGIGRRAAAQIFARYSGRWSVQWLLANETAKAFWLAVTAGFSAVALDSPHEGNEGIQFVQSSG